MVSKLLKNMIRVVHPGSRIRMLTFSHPGSRTQGSKSTQSRIPDPDPQHCLNISQKRSKLSSMLFKALRGDQNQCSEEQLLNFECSFN
jgi:hypothetical protein